MNTYKLKFVLYCKEEIEADTSNEAKEILHKKYSNNYLDFDFSTTQTVDVYSLTKIRST